MLSRKAIWDLLEKSREEVWDQERLAYELQVLLYHGGDALEKVGSAHRSADGRRWQVHDSNSLHMNDHPVYVLREDVGVLADQGVFTLLIGSLPDKVTEKVRALLEAYDSGAVARLDGPMEELRTVVDE